MLTTPLTAIQVIKLKCKCGSTLEISDPRGTYISLGGGPDAKGRKYLIEVRADEWLDRHQACLAVKED